MTPRHQNRWRSFFAALCLIAVVLLYAPFGAAAWALHTGKCCTSDAQCPIHGHRHAQIPAGAKHAMDCGHEMSTMAQCSMSCCHNPERPAVTPAIFVLAAPLTISAAATFESLAALTGPENSVNSLEPLSPPPRFSTLAA